MVDVATLKLRYDGTELRRAPGDLNAVTQSAKRTEAQTTKVGTAAKRAGMEMGRAGGGGVRMMSMQLSQVAQQGAVTGNYFRALTTQAADIGLAFGAVGIAIGAAITVFGGVVSGMLEASNGAKALEDALEGVDEVAEGLQDSLDTLNMSARELADRYGDAAKRVREFALAQAELRASQADARLREQLAVLDDVMAAYTSGDMTGPLAQSLQAIQRDFGVAREGANALRAAMERISNAGTFDAEQEALGGFLNLLEELNVPLSRIPEDLQTAIDEMITLGRETDAARDLAQELKEFLEGGAAPARVIATLDMAGSIGAAVGPAAALAAELRAAAAASELIARTSTVESTALSFGFPSGSPFGPGVGGGTPLGFGNLNGPRRRNITPLAVLGGARSGGGAGGAAVRNESLEQLKRLYRETRTEAEMFAIQLKELDELFAATDGFAGYGGQDTYNRKLQSLKEEFQELPSLAQDAASAIRSAFDGLFDDPAQALENLAKELAQMALFATLARGFPGIFGGGGIIPLLNAGGNAFMGGRVIPFAHGGVVSGPALFPMKNGTGMMGEAGPEAIMPLKRGADGKLGVAGGGGGTVVTIINNSGQPVRESRERGPDGRELVSIVVGEELARGSFDRQLNGRYGSQPRVVRR